MLKDGWFASLVQCVICTNKFTSVYPECAEEDRLECPLCGAQDSVITERYGPDQLTIVLESASDDGLYLYE